MKKTIFHLITGLDVGGAEKMLLKILPLLQNNFNNHVICIKGYGEIGRELQEKGIKVHYLNLKNIFDLGLIIKFQSLIKKYQPDLLVTYLIHADLFGRIFGKLFGIKKIICSVRVKPLNEIKYFPLFILDGLTSFLVNHYHFNSQTVANFYKKYFFLSSKKITVIPNGLELDKYDIKIDINKKKKELGLPINKKIVGCVAKLRKQKGHKYLLKAFQQVQKELKDVILVLVGNGEEIDNLKKLAKDLEIDKNTYFLGDRNDIPEILKTFDVFVLPTLAEGMSNAIMEAMASEVPVITTDIKENQELIKDNESGIVISLKNSKNLHEKILQILKDNNKRHSITYKAKQFIKNNFDIKTNILNWNKLFNINQK